MQVGSSFPKQRTSASQFPGKRWLLCYQYLYNTSLAVIYRALQQVQHLLELLGAL